MASNSNFTDQLPSNTSSAALGDDDLRSIKSFMFNWWEDEHFALDGSANSAGVHKAGSARAFSQAAAPTAVLPAGQIWHDTDNDNLFVATAAGTGSWLTVADATFAASVNTWTALQNFSSGATIDTVDINGGTIDGTSFGASVRGAMNCTTFSASYPSGFATMTNTETPDPDGLEIIFANVDPLDNTQFFLRCTDSTTARCIIYSDGDLVNRDGAYGTISDETLKTDIVAAKSQWDDVKALSKAAKNFRLIGDIEILGEDAKVLLGWIAQEVEEFSPGLVGVGQDGLCFLKQSIIHNKTTIALGEALERIEALEVRLEGV